MQQEQQLATWRQPRTIDRRRLEVSALEVCRHCDIHAPRMRQLQLGDDGDKHGFCLASSKARIKALLPGNSRRRASLVVVTGKHSTVIWKRKLLLHHRLTQGVRASFLKVRATTATNQQRIPSKRHLQIQSDIGHAAAGVTGSLARLQSISTKPNYILRHHF